MEKTKKYIAIAAVVLLAVLAVGLFIKARRKPQEEPELSEMTVYEPTETPESETAEPTIQAESRSTEATYTAPGTESTLSVPAETRAKIESETNLVEYMTKRMQVTNTARSCVGRQYTTHELLNTCYSVNNTISFDDVSAEELYGKYPSVSPEWVLEGDLVFYTEQDGTPFAIAIYRGQNKVVMSGSDGTVVEQTIESAGGDFVFARVLVDEQSVAEETKQEALLHFGYLKPMIPDFTAEQLAMIDGKSWEFGCCLANWMIENFHVNGELPVTVTQVKDHGDKYVFNTSCGDPMLNGTVFYDKNTHEFSCLV